MFNRNDFELFLSTQNQVISLPEEYLGISRKHYSPCDFVSPSSEEYIWITYAPKNVGDNGLKFWLHAECADDWLGKEDYILPYLSGAYFKTIDELTFKDLLNTHCKDLIRQPDFSFIDKQIFCGALLMYEIDTELSVSVFAEYENLYVHFRWESTA